MKIALLSNINIDPAINILSERHEIYKNEGYGGIFEVLLNEASSFHVFRPEAVFIVNDIALCTQDCTTDEDARRSVDAWFDVMEKCIRPETTYFIANADYRTRLASIGSVDENTPGKRERAFDEALLNFMQNYPNVHLFPYRELAEKMGKAAFYSNKLWYLGKIIHTSSAHEQIAAQVEEMLRLLTYTPKKVLALDLDNTLWGGVVGEAGAEGIGLSEEKLGMVYKDAQRIVKHIKETGVVLAVVSKNNEADAMDVIKSHPHMLLREEDFAVLKINWENKHENILAIAQELNIGLDSIVFIDDSPAERDLVTQLLPEVTVPDFPEQVERLADFFADIYDRYFKKLSLTKEDAEKTQLYQDNAKRSKLAGAISDFPSFLRQLDMECTAIRPADAQLERLHQLVSKTNQFNLTTRRHSKNDLGEMTRSDHAACYLFSLRDKFGEYGQIGAVIVDLFSETPKIDSFVLSCRAMGKLVENYMLDYVERDMRQMGFETLLAEYIPTEKNIPAAEFFERNGYTVAEENEGTKQYSIRLDTRPAREYYLKETE
ncbi:MAG: HAD-IIIC family phosphatase [Christensenellaceae bacterium]|jgi:FkbH-like protein